VNKFKTFVIAAAAVSAALLGTSLVPLTTSAVICDPTICRLGGLAVATIHAYAM
jgi:hypothetical protein